MKSFVPVELMSIVTLALTATVTNAFAFDPTFKPQHNYLTPRAASCNANSASGRTIGYYQMNADQRSCDSISISSISTENLSHLYVAFIEFDPTNFTITAANNTNLAAYGNFSSLQSPSLQTWISVGGFAFSATGSPTEQAWSSMTSTSANRATFISSLKSFMTQYKFQGADLDWEFPGQAANGGNSNDKANLVSLLSEMRTSFGTDFGISLTLPTDAGYLANYNLPALQSSVDWFGLMSYDLYSYSNTTAYVEGHTDIRIINSTVATLTSAGVDMSKVNMGLAAYGRGYTLSNTTCNYLGCPASGLSTAGTCVGEPGVMSLMEIQNMVAQTNVTPQYNPAIEMMQISYGNQFVAYDDEYTFYLKKQFADANCMGGTMMWSIDLDNGLANIPDLAQTTTGTCGSQHNNTICGTWAAGSCCSAYGFCGNTTQDYCGVGCQSGGCNALPEISHASTGSGTSTAKSAAGRSAEVGWIALVAVALASMFVL